jgi:hypothetical protein
LEELKAGAGKYDDKAASAEMDNEPDGNASKKAKLDFTVIEVSGLISNSALVVSSRISILAL